MKHLKQKCYERSISSGSTSKPLSAQFTPYTGASLCVREWKKEERKGPRKQGSMKLPAFPWRPTHATSLSARCLAVSACNTSLALPPFFDSFASFPCRLCAGDRAGMMSGSTESTKSSHGDQHPVTAIHRPLPPVKNTSSSRYSKWFTRSLGSSWAGGLTVIDGKARKVANWVFKREHAPKSPEHARGQWLLRLKKERIHFLRGEIQVNHLTVSTKYRASRICLTFNFPYPPAPVRCAFIEVGEASYRKSIREFFTTRRGIVIRAGDARDEAVVPVRAGRRDMSLSSAVGVRAPAGGNVEDLLTEAPVSRAEVRELFDSWRNSPSDSGVDPTGSSGQQSSFSVKLVFLSFRLSLVRTAWLAGRLIVFRLVARHALAAFFSAPMRGTSVTWRVSCPFSTGRTRSNRLSVIEDHFTRRVVSPHCIFGSCLVDWVL